MTSGQERERTNSYNPGAGTGHINHKCFCLPAWCLTTLSAQITLYRATGQHNRIMQLNNEKNTINQDNHKHSLAPALWRPSFCPRRGFLGGVFLANNNNNNNNNNAIRRIKGRRKYTLTKGPFASACILTIRVDKTDFFMSEIVKPTLV